LTGLIILVFCLLCSLFFIIRNVSLKNRLESSQLSFENLLSEKLQVEKRYHDIRDELDSVKAARIGQIQVFDAKSRISREDSPKEQKQGKGLWTIPKLVALKDSLEHVIYLRDQELIHLSKKIDELNDLIHNENR
jgi:hypothetical protein